MKLAILILCLLAGFCPVGVRGDMTSTNYNIYADSFSSGGDNATGGVYALDDVIGQSPAGEMTGGTYTVNGGYMSSVSSSLSVSFDTTSVSLGVLSVGAVSTGSVVATISSDSDGGYALTVGTVSGTVITGVADGAVTAGAEEYGLAVSGTGSVVLGDVAVASALSLVSTAIPAYNTQITITFKASKSGATAAGSYSQTVPLIAAPNF
ncbi:MAG: hypothetical protein Q7S66_00350 [bacterium]|nr:hypothetical protein [bacterium]